MGTVEVLHLDIGGTEFLKSMSVRARSPSRPEDFAQVLRAAIGLLIGTRIEDLDNVDQSCQMLDGLLAEVPTKRVIRVLEIHKTPLVLDLEYGLSGCETGLNRSLQEQTYELASAGHDFFADHNAIFAGTLKPSRPRYGVMVSKNDRAQPQAMAPFGDALGLGATVE